MNSRDAFGIQRRRGSMIALLVAALAITALLLSAAGAQAEEEEGGFPGAIEGTVAKEKAENLFGIEICAFNTVRIDAECALTQANGKYVIKGLDSGYYRVEFKNAVYGYHYITQWWKGAASKEEATPVWVAERGTTTGINAEMKLPPSVAASGPVEFGDRCEFSYIGAGTASFEFSRPRNPLPTAAPVAGVLTSWIVTTPPGTPEELAPVDVRVVHLLGGSTAEIVAKSALEKLKPGKNTFETRLPIEAGDHLAIGSNRSPSPGCGESVGAEPIEGAFFEAPVGQPGQKQTFYANSEGTPVVGVVEPDEDGDGYGDETQDGCPQSAAFQTACPTVSFAPAYSVGPRAIKVKVRSSASTPVAVTGASPGPGLLAATKKLKRGKVEAIAVPIPRALANRLGRLPSSKALQVRLRAHATKVNGMPSTDRLWVRLPGRLGENEFANPGSIEGTVTKAGGGALRGVEACAFDVAEDEEFTECAETKSDGSYEIDGLDEGPYRVEFESGSSGLNLATQWWKNASSIGAATIVRVEEAKAITGVDATMRVAAR